jgi:hypothetical protein
MSSSSEEALDEHLLRLEKKSPESSEISMYMLLASKSKKQIIVRLSFP